MAGEQGEQVELGGGDLDVQSVGAEQAPFLQVELAAPEGDAVGCRRARRHGRPGGRRLPGAAQQRPHAGQQFAQLEGLADVVVRAHLQADDPVHRFAGGGQHQLADARMRGAQPAGQRKPVLSRHVEIEDGQVRRRLGDGQARGGGIRHGADEVAVAAEILGQQQAQLRFIVDNQDHRHARPQRNSLARVYRPGGAAGDFIAVPMPVLMHHAANELAERHNRAECAPAAFTFPVYR